MAHDRSDVITVFDEIMRAIDDKRPLSMIRLGDGEGRFMAYPNSASKEILDFTLLSWFGHTDFDTEILENLSIQIKESVSDADIVGLPRLKQTPNRAYQYVLDVIASENLMQRKTMITDAAIHRYLQFCLFYRDIFNKVDFIGLINGRDIRGNLEEYFGHKEMDYYEIPTQARCVDYQVGNHYPDKFLKLKDELIVPYVGAVFLVGAGGPGKVYCKWIKEKGGIALDIGAIFDSWAGEGRLQNPIHSLESYRQYPSLSLGDIKKRFNECCDYFDIDTSRF